MTANTATSIQDAYVAAHRAAAQWIAERDRLAALLIDEYDAGNIPQKFTASHATVSLSPGRKTWKYANAIKARIKAIQEIAQQDGEAEQVVGSPFWTVRYTA